MILVTGATGFVGRHLVQRLSADAGLRVRVLLRPGSDINRLPRPLTVHTLIGDITDGDSLLAAMDGVHTVFHLVGTETRGRHARLSDVDVAGAKAVVKAALTARVGRIITVSRLGAERASAFPVLRAKGEIEDCIRNSGLAYTIFRPGVLFGHGDRFARNHGLVNIAGTFQYNSVHRNFFPRPNPQAVARLNVFKRHICFRSIGVDASRGFRG